MQANTKRTRSTLKKRRPDAPPRSQSANNTVFSEALQDHRRSQFFRPKSAGGNEKNVRRSFSRPRTARDGQTHVQPLPDYEGQQQQQREIMEFSVGSEIFSFPTPTPRQEGFEKGILGELRMLDSPPIGVALGSPSHPPAWGQSDTADQYRERRAMGRQRMPRNGVPSVVAEDVEVQSKEKADVVKRKRTGWKALGSLFRRQSSKQSVADGAHHLSTMAGELTKVSPPNGIHMTSDSPSQIMPLRSPSTIHRHASRSPSWTRGLARVEARSATDRASFMPHIETKMHRMPSQRENLNPGFNTHPLRVSMDFSIPTTTANERHDSPLSTEPPKLDVVIPRTPKLDLEIPAPELERYSVMFGKLLATEEPKLSILERRQEKFDQNKFYFIDGKPGATANATPRTGIQEGAVPQRSVSVTAAPANRMPTLTIKVNDRMAERKMRETSATAFHRPRPKRALTAPTETMHAVVSVKERTVGRIPAVVEESALAAPAVQREIPPYDPACDQTRPERERLTSTPPTSPDDALVPVPPVIVQAATPTATSTPGSRPSPSPPRPESRLGNHKLKYPKIRGPEDLEKQIIQVSVARQVSVSQARGRAERAMMGPGVERPRVVTMSRRVSKAGVVGVVEDVSE